MMADNELPPTSLTQPRRRWWLPIVWPLLLAVICAAVWAAGIERGVVNGAVYSALGLTLLGWAIWIVRSRLLNRPLRWGLSALLLLIPAAVMLQFSPVELVMDGNMTIVDWHWRWEEPDLKLAAPVVATERSIEWRETPQDYPRFLGNGYWAEVKGVELETDWERFPPRELWRQEIGAGWSGFAIAGDYAVTQEQRGDLELVVCYELRTGDVAWTHSDPVRWDPIAQGALGGIGPRATPTVHEGKVITHGATGIVNCLEARTGKLLWSHDTLEEHGAEMVMWGKANSPLMVDDLVVISVGGTNDASLVAYEIETGEQAWAAGRHRSSYASPVLAELAGVRQIVSVNEDFVTGHDPNDGHQLWEFEWEGSSDTNAIASQPVPVGDDRIFLSKGYGGGAELIRIERGEDGTLAPTSLWKNPSVLRTKFGNVVVHDGHVYGLNDAILQCIELETGRSRWKKRRSPEFGHGQIMLVGNVVLMLSEKGELILFAASPKQYQELASHQALEGITWNNPALAGNILLVRNATEAACFELQLRAGESVAAKLAPGQ